MARCSRCNTYVPTGDKMAQIAHKAKCARNVFNAGLHYPGKKYCNRCGGNFPNQAALDKHRPCKK